MSLRQLQEEREKLVVAARERLDQINDNTDEARAAELETQHDAALAELDKLDAKIGREQRVADAERRQDELRDSAARETRDRRPVGTVDGREQRGDGGELSYRQAFHMYLRSKLEDGPALTDEARAVLKTGYQELKPEERAQTTSNTSGGYTVPVELQAEIIKTMKLWGPMYDPAITREMVTSSGAGMPWPTVDDTANSASGTTQGTTLTDDGSGDVVFGQKQLDAFSYSTPWLRISKELMDDSIVNIESVIGDLLGERLGRLANTQLTTGSGSSAPNGIVTATSAGKTAASTTAFTADEIIDLEHSVDAAYRMSPKFAYMFHDLVLAAVRKLKDGQGNYLWQAGNVQAGVPSTLNGRNFWVNNAMSSAFTTGQKLILAGDFGKYFVRKVGAPLIGAIQDKDFWPGIGMAGWIRFDGDLMDTAAVKHLKLA